MSRQFRSFLPTVIILLGATLFACGIFSAAPTLAPTLAPTSIPSKTHTAVPSATKLSTATAKPVDTATLVPLPSATSTVVPSETPTVLDGKTLLEQRCNACHPSSYVAQLRGTPDQWAGLVAMMVQNGAELTPQEEKVLSAYLAQMYH